MNLFRILAGLCCLHLFGNVTTTLAQSAPQTQVLFKKPKSEGEYRIPGLITLKSGTVLAFCADRKGRGDFNHETTTVLRRSIDGGKTWGPLQEITAAKGVDIHSGPVVQDRSTGRIFKFCRFWPATKDAKKITDTKTYEEMCQLGWNDYVQTSDDDGKTWTAPAPILIDYPASSYSAATGNGVHGIQLTDGTLMIQGGYSLKKDGRLNRQCCVIRSKDGGKTWSRQWDIDTADINVIREFVMAEKHDGSVMCNVRSTKKWRAIFEGGTLRHDDELRDIECHAGLTVHQSPDQRTSYWLFTHPNPIGASANDTFNRRRQRLVIRVSQNEGQTWPAEIVVHAKAAAYSDIAITTDSTAIVLFENGQTIGDCYQQISIARVDWKSSVNKDD